MPAKSHRDDFPAGAADAIARRAGMRCSWPNCDQLTSGPRSEPDKSVNIGVAAHITAAAPGGPRYDAALTAEERSAPANGIWLCQNHAKLVDNDPKRYPAVQLREWKILAPLVPAAKPGGRPRKHDTRTLLDAMFYFVRAGCAWRLLPWHFPPWKTVYHYLRRWRLDGTWEELLAALRGGCAWPAGARPSRVPPCWTAAR